MSTTALRSVLAWVASGDAHPDHEKAVQELEAMIASLQPFAHYARMRAAKPLRNAAGVIHGIHSGTEWEAEITIQDCEAARKALEGA